MSIIILDNFTCKNQVTFCHTFCDTCDKSHFWCAQLNVDAFKYLFDKFGPRITLLVDKCDHDYCKCGRRAICKIVNLWMDADFGMTWGEWADRAGLIKKAE